MKMMMRRRRTAPATHCNGLSIPQGHPEEDQEDEEDGGEDGRQWIVPDGDGHDDDAGDEKIKRPDACPIHEHCELFNLILS